MRIKLELKQRGEMPILFINDKDFSVDFAKAIVETYKTLRVDKKEFSRKKDELIENFIFRISNKFSLEEIEDINKELENIMYTNTEKIKRIMEENIDIIYLLFLIFILILIKI